MQALPHLAGTAGTHERREDAWPEGARDAAQQQQLAGVGPLSCVALVALGVLGEGTAEVERQSLQESIESEAAAAIDVYQILCRACTGPAAGPEASGAAHAGATASNARESLAGCSRRLMHDARRALTRCT